MLMNRILEMFKMVTVMDTGTDTDSGNGYVYGYR